MKVFRAVLCLVGLFAALPVYGAQKTIAISDSLAANSDQLDVKMGTQWFGRIAKWSFGDFAVVSSKTGGTSVRTKTNFFHTKSESTATENFSFVMVNHASDSASVHAAHVAKSRAAHAVRVTKGLSLGDDGVQAESNLFTAFITINGDTADTWTLSMGGTTVQGQPTSVEMSLTNGGRRILMNSVTAARPGDAPRRFKLSSLFSAPARGIEYVENGASLCAVQYSHGGLGKDANTQKIWIHRRLEPKQQLMLAAAMTATLQMLGSESAAAQE